MAQSSEIKLLKRFDQNIEVTGTIKIGVREQTTAGDYVSNKLTLIPPYHTGGPFNIRTRDDASNAFISIAYGSNEVATIKHDGTIKIGSNTVIHSGNISSYALTSFDITTQTDPKYLRSNADDTTSGNITISKNAPSIYLYDPNTSNTNYPELRFNTGNNQGVKLVHNEFDNELPTAGYGLILTGDNNNTQFGTTGTLSFVVHGNIYAGGTTNSTVSRVLTTADEGSGNGLDADTLDGQHASAFLTSLPSHSHQQLSGFANQTEYDVITSGNLNGLRMKARWDSATTDRWWDLGFIDGFGTFYSGLKVYNNGDLTYKGNTIIDSSTIGSQSVNYATTAGSVANADTVDNLHASSFLRSDANDTMNGTLTMNSTLLMNNYNIEGVNHLKFNDAGANEGLEWVGGSGWKIYESGNSLDNTSGNLQFVTGSTRRMTLNTSGILEVFGSSLEINGKYARDFAHSRYISGGGSLYGSGTSGWTKVAQVTVTGNCSGAVLYGKMFSRAYHEAEIYNIAVVIRAECDFTSNNESHFIEFGCTAAASSENTDYRNRIRAVLVESSTNRRTYEVQFFETAWNDNWWELWTSGFTIYETPQTPGTATGTARINYRSRLGADDLYARNGAYAPTFYDRDNTSYYLNAASTSNLNDIDADHLNLGGASGDDGEDLKVGGIRGRFANELIHLYNRVNIGYPSGWAGQDAPNYGISTYGSADLATNTGYTTSGGSMRAPIFYDSDNTTYYLNPGTTGISFYTQGRISQINQSNSTWPYLFVTSSVGNDNHSGFWVGSNGYPDMRLRRENSTVRALISSWERSYTSFGFTDSTDMRSPIFYDNNNTGYYLNPASTSQLNDINASAFIGPLYREDNRVISPSELGSGRMRFGFGSFGNNNTSPWSSHLHMRSYTDSSGGNDLLVVFKKANPSKVRVYSQTYGSSTAYSDYIDLIDTSTDDQVKSGYFQSNESLRAPIFYDSDNTGYYVDPASTSNFNRIDFNRYLYGNGKKIFDCYDTYLRLNQGGEWSNGIWFGNSHIKQGSDRFITAGGNGGTTNSRVYIYGGTYSGANVIKIDGNSGIIQTTTDSMRAPMFYDYDNTTYYTNPGGFSNFYSGNFSSTLSVNNGQQIRFSGASDGNHFVRKVATGYSSVTIDGPQLQGHQGGELTTNYTGNNWALRWAIGGVVYVNSTFHAGGDILAYSSSDEQLKDNIKPIENPIDKVQKISGVEFDWNEKQDTYEHGKHDVGVIAQEIEEVLPDIVTTRDNGYKAVKYEKIVPLLIEAIKEQQKQIDELKKLINP